LCPPDGRGGGELDGGGLLLGGWDVLGGALVGGTELLDGALLDGVLLVGGADELLGGSLDGVLLVGGADELSLGDGVGAGPVVTCSSGGWSVFRPAQDHRMLLWVAATKEYRPEPSMAEVTSAVV